MVDKLGYNIIRKDGDIITFDETPKYYVYKWIIDETDQIIYIGKGTGQRYRTRKRENSYFMKMVESHNCHPEIIKDNLTEKEAFDLEIKLISEIRKDPRNRLTNICDGGENPPKHNGLKRTDETKKKMSDSMNSFYEKHPEVREKASRKMKDFFKTPEGKEFQRKSIESRNNDEFRKAQSERCRAANNTKEYLERQSKIVKEMWKSEEYRKAHLGKNNPQSQEVAQYDLSGNLLNTYPTLTQASKESGANISKICAVARGKRKTAGGYVWKYTNQKDIKSYDRTKYSFDYSKFKKPIIQLDKEGNIISEFDSIREASRKCGFHNASIQKCLKGTLKTAHGYVWRYK